MSRGFKFIVVFILILALSVCLTPFLYKVLPMFKFEKIFNRLVMVLSVAAAALYVWLRSKEKEKLLTGDLWKVCGFDFGKPWKKLLLYGFVMGFLAVLFITVIETKFGPRYLRNPILIQDVVERFLKGMMTGCTVGLVEEFFFRGFLYTQLRKRTGVIAGVLLASVIYAVSHFLDNGQVFIPDNPSVGDAFRLLLGFLEPIFNRSAVIVPQLVGLFLFGIVLNTAFIRSKSIYLNMGIHAGAVFWIKFQSSFVRKEISDFYHPFYGNTPDYDGAFEWLALIALAFVVFWIAPRLISSSKDCSRVN